MNVIDNLEFTPFRSAARPPSALDRIRSLFGRNRKASGREPAKSDAATYSLCQPDDRLDQYRQLLEDACAIHVFRNGTAVFSDDPMTDDESIEILHHFGRNVIGTPQSDFHIAVIESPVSGFVVRYAHPQILSFWDRDECPLNAPFSMADSMIRLSREMDSHDLHIVARYARDE